VTGGNAWEMAEKSAAQVRQELAAVVCVNGFVAAPDAHTQLAGLKEMTSSYKRGKFVEDGGWAMIVPANSSAEPASPVSSSDHRRGTREARDPRERERRADQ
jgi:hypothetical protein